MIAQLIGHLPFWQIYVILLLASLGFLFALSFLFYLPLYKSALREPAFVWKTQLRWPTDATIQREIFWAVVGACFAVLNPAIAIWLQVHHMNKMYSNISDYGYGYWAVSWVALFLYNEVFQWYWHKCSHEYKFLWQFHKIHHKFHNPSPISVVSNHPVDIFMQSSPILVVPFLFPIHDATLYLTFALINYAYGAALHAGFDWPYAVTSPHNKWIVTPWHHNHHHHHSGFGKAINTGFVLAIVDQLGGTFQGPNDFNPKTCDCPHCRPASVVEAARTAIKTAAAQADSKDD